MLAAVPPLTEHRPLASSTHSDSQENELVNTYREVCRSLKVKKPNSIVRNSLAASGPLSSALTVFSVNTYLGNKGVLAVLETLLSHCRHTLHTLLLSGVGLVNDTCEQHYFLNVMNCLSKFTALRVLDLSGNHLVEEGSPAGEASSMAGHILHLVQENKQVLFLDVSGTGLTELFVSKMNKILFERRKNSISLSPKRPKIVNGRRVSRDVVKVVEDPQETRPHSPNTAFKTVASSVESLESATSAKEVTPLDTPNPPKTISYATKLPIAGQKEPLVGYSLLGMSGSLAAVTAKKRAGTPNSNSVSTRDSEVCKDVADWIRAKKAKEDSTASLVGSTLRSEVEEEDDGLSRPLPKWVGHSLVELRRRLVRNKHSILKVYELFVLSEEEQTQVKYADGVYDGNRKLPGLFTPQDSEANYKKEISFPESSVSTTVERKELWTIRNTGQCSWRAFFKGLRLLNVRYASKDLATSILFASTLGILKGDHVDLGTLLLFLRPLARVEADTPWFATLLETPKLPDIIGRSCASDTYVSKYTLYGPDLSVSAGASPGISTELGNTVSQSDRYGSGRRLHYSASPSMGRGTSFDDYRPLGYGGSDRASSVNGVVEDIVLLHTNRDGISKEVQVVLNILYDFRHEMRRVLRRLGITVEIEEGATTVVSSTNEEEEEDDHLPDNGYLPITKESETTTLENHPVGVTYVSYTQLYNVCTSFASMVPPPAVEAALARCHITRGSTPEACTLDFETSFLRKLTLPKLRGAEKSHAISLLGYIKLEDTPQDSVLEQHEEGVVRSLDAVSPQRERELWSRVTVGRLQGLLRAYV